MVVKHKGKRESLKESLKENERAILGKGRESHGEEDIWGETDG